MESLWTWTDYGGGAVASEVWTGAVVSGGASSFLAQIDPKHMGVVTTTSGSTINGGYRLLTTSVVQLAGFSGLCSRQIMQPKLDAAGTTLRFGFLDSGIITAPVDGAYFQILNLTLEAICRSASTQSAASPTLTLTVDTWYTLDIDYVSDTEVRFVVSNDAGVNLYSHTVTTNVPNTAARAFGHGYVGTNSTGGSSRDLAWIDYQGMGPVRPYYCPVPP